MSAISGRLDVLADFQWLVIPHGRNSSGTHLKATIRVIPRLKPIADSDSDGMSVAELRKQSGHVDLQPVVDWPRFLGERINGIQIVSDLPGTPDWTLDPRALWKSKCCDLGIGLEEASDVWRQLVPANCSVKFAQDGRPRTTTYWRPHDHAALVEEAAKAVGEIHASSLRRNAQSWMGIRAGRATHPASAMIVQSSFDSTASLYGLSAIHAPLQSHQYVLNWLKRNDAARNSNDPLLSWTSQRFGLDLTKGHLADDEANPYRLSRAAINHLLAPQPRKPTIFHHVLDRMRDMVPDRRIEGRAPKPAEFHAQIGALALHPWLLTALGLVIDVEIPIPQYMPAEFALRVRRITVDGGRHILPHDHSYVVADGRTCLPKVDGRYGDVPLVGGCVRIADPTAGFSVKQLDIDSTVEKLNQSANVLASQEANGLLETDRQTRLAGLKTSGLSLLKASPHSTLAMVQRHRDRLVARLTDRNFGARSGRAYYANDLIIGFRPDISTLETSTEGRSCPRPWKSIVGRQPRSLEANGRNLLGLWRNVAADEGMVAILSRKMSADGKSEVLLPQQEIFCWKNWTLSAPPVEATPVTSSDFKVNYLAAPGQPKQRFGWGYRVGLRIVYADGRSVTTDEAAKWYNDDQLQCALGDGNDFMAFRRFESVPPPDVHVHGSLDAVLPHESASRMLVASRDAAHVPRRRSSRMIVPPRVDIDLAIKLGAFDKKAMHARPPASAFQGVRLNEDGSFPSLGNPLFAGGAVSSFETTVFRRSPFANPPRVPYLPDPWAKRLLVGIYRHADDRLLEIQYHDYYDANHQWPNCRPLQLDIVADHTQLLAHRWYDIRTSPGEIELRLRPGKDLRIRLWHEMDEALLSRSAVVDQMLDYLVSDFGKSCALALGLDPQSLGADEMIKCLTHWHERHAEALKEAVVGGKRERLVNMASFWMLNPATQIEAVHLASQPLAPLEFARGDPTDVQLQRVAPATASLLVTRFDVAERHEGDSIARFEGDIEFDRATTSQVDCHGTWREFDDDPAKGERMSVQSREAIMFSFRDLPGVLTNPYLKVKDRAHSSAEAPTDNDLLRLLGPNAVIGRDSNADLDRKEQSPASYDFRDCRARRVSLSLVSQPRNGPDLKALQPRSRRSTEETHRWVKCTAVPPPPVISHIVPMLSSSYDAGANGVRHQRRGGLFRVWLERPWFSSGEGELLALACWPEDLLRPRVMRADYSRSPQSRDGRVFPMPPKALDPLSDLVTAWGHDPLWEEASRLSLLPASAFRNRMSVDLASAVPQEMRRIGSRQRVGLALYQPLYDVESRRWYADIEIDPGTAYFPFVRLALARYQPNSIEGCEMSPLARGEFVQLMPSRTASLTVEKISVRRAKVSLAVSGPMPTRQSFRGVIGGIGPSAPKLVMRVDENPFPPPVVSDSSEPQPVRSYVDELDASAAWLPLGDDRDEGIVLDSTGQSEWRGTAAIEVRPFCRYSVYLEEREPVIVDEESNGNSALAARSSKPALGYRVTYSDRLLLNL